MEKLVVQKHWSEGKGLFIIGAFFCGGVAGGLYLTSLYFNVLWGMFIALICALIMGIFDLGHLKRKTIVWRIASRPGSSWISIGFIFVILFIGAAAIQMILARWSPGSGVEVFFKVVAGITAFVVAVYSGFVISLANGIKFWNSAIMPILFLVTGFVGGSAILLVISSFIGGLPFADLQSFAMIILSAYTVIIFLHLWISYNNNYVAKVSARAIISGNLAYLFWIVVILIGIVAPLVIEFMANSDSTALLIVNAVCILAGNLILRYIIMKAGYYSPVIPKPLDNKLNFATNEH
jgi:formate-dependent nitrite reductase membrane component NrfD